jgi:adenylate cyclase
MMVFFGVPEKIEAKEAALGCVRMAIEMRRSVEALRRKWDDAGFDWQLSVRIGINEERMNYTAIGSDVNLASRLESSGEAGEITISHSTHALVKDCFDCEARGEISVKGFAQACLFLALAPASESA